MQKSLLIFLLSITSGMSDARPPSYPITPEPGTAPLVDQFNQAAAQTLLAKGIDELVFIKRNTLDSDHYYTEYVNSTWKPGGNLCVLNLHTGSVRELIPEFSGVFNRFDVSFDAQKIVFDYKKGKMDGYRLYEINVDGTGLHQLTFSEAEEEKYHALGWGGYHHGTDDLHPCYLPDGGIAFVSTRCKYGILCNQSDLFTTKVVYRMNGDGSDIRALSNSSVSEAAPVMMTDGRIMYHRWEYNDKVSGPVKCLWAMRPDGTGSVELYGNTLRKPETLIYGRPIPGAPHKFVSLGTSHCGPNNALGTVLKIDTTQDTHTTKPLSYITKDVDAFGHKGFNFHVEGEWVFDQTGRQGRLFKDPYPISEDLFIVTEKPKGFPWHNPAAYDLSLLDGDGNSTPLYCDKSISCWHPFPLTPRTKPPVLGSVLNEDLAARDKAVCTVTDVYVGLAGVERGTIKYLRIMEQVPRPWSARRKWNGDKWGMAHSALGLGRLGLKVQYGVVPVEVDGSAHFEVPANRNIYYQVLDENFMMVQTERTYINYMPGESRSCIGCHETQNTTPPSQNRMPLALKRAPSEAQAQPGDRAAARVIDYERQVQPVLDRHCISCHNDQKQMGKLNLSGTATELYSVSYEALMGPEKSTTVCAAGNRFLADENLINEDVSYQQAYSGGSHTSPLVIALSGGRITPKAVQNERLAKAHKNVQLSQEEFIAVVNWIDSFGQYYPSYYGIKNWAFNQHPDSRPAMSFDDAIAREIPASLQELYANPPNPKKGKE